MKKYGWITALALLLVVNTSYGSWFDFHSQPQDLSTIKLQSGLVMPQAKPLRFFEQQKLNNHHDFYFTDQNGQPFGLANLQNHWTLVFFGFTYCPMLCPTTLAQLSNAYQQWQTDHVSPLPQVVFVTIDPERDSLAKVKQFVHTFNPNFIGLRTDDTTALAAFARQLDASYEKVNGSGKDKDKKGQYTYTHTGDIAVIDPHGDLVAVLIMPHSDKNIAADYQTIVEKLAR